MAAIPNPEQELTRCRRGVSGGLPPLVLISGPSVFFRTEAFDLALAAVPAGAELRIIDGRQETDGREIDDLRSGSLFAPGSWLAVRRGDAWLAARGPELQAVVGKFAPGCGLLLEISKLDGRTKLAKSLTKLAEVFRFRDLYAEPYDRRRSPLEAELVSWIVGRAKSHGVVLDRRGAFLLMATVGSQPAELVAELGRLVDVLPKNRAAVSLDVLREHLHCGFESTPFEFAEAVLGGDRRRAERSLEAMFARGVRGREGQSVDSGGVFPFVTSWLHQSFSNVHDGRRLLDAGVALADVPRRVGVRTFAERFSAQVESNSEARLRFGLERLLECQRQLRLSGEEPARLLQRFLADFFGAAGVTAGG